MIILLLINILELLAIVYLLWILFEQVMDYEHLNDLHDNALNSLEKITTERDYWRNEYYRSTSETKADLLKQNDEYKNTINKIREIAKILTRSIACPHNLHLDDNYTLKNGLMPKEKVLKSSKIF